MLFKAFFVHYLMLFSLVTVIIFNIVWIFFFWAQIVNRSSLLTRLILLQMAITENYLFILTVWNYLENPFKVLL